MSQVHVHTNILLKKNSQLQADVIFYEQIVSATNKLAMDVQWTHQ